MPAEPSGDLRSQSRLPIRVHRHPPSASASAPPSQAQSQRSMTDAVAISTERAASRAMQPASPEGVGLPVKMQMQMREGMPGSKIQNHTLHGPKDCGLSSSTGMKRRGEPENLSPWKNTIRSLYRLDCSTSAFFPTPLLSRLVRSARPRPSAQPYRSTFPHPLSQVIIPTPMSTTPSILA